MYTLEEKEKEERSHMDMPHVKGDCDGLAEWGALACNLTVVAVVNAGKSKTSCSRSRIVLQCMGIVLQCTESPEKVGKSC